MSAQHLFCTAVCIGKVGGKFYIFVSKSMWCVCVCVCVCESPAFSCTGVCKARGEVAKFTHFCLEKACGVTV